jgi:hypothetical protein
MLLVCFVNAQSVDRIICSTFQRFNLEWKTGTLKQLGITPVRAFRLTRFPCPPYNPSCLHPIWNCG